MKDNHITNIAFFFLMIFHLSSCTKVGKKEAVEERDKPNVIIVITDDQGYGDFGHTGNPILKTSAIDEFAETFEVT